ncbi:acyltransferase domain-containing protein, partial [Actinoallomurus acaciae]
MAAIEATPDELAESLSEYQGQATLAAVNGPKAVVVSGNQDAVLAIAAHWATQGRRTRQLTVSHAFHSPHMDTITEELTQAAAKITVQPPRIPLISCLTGDFIDIEQLSTPDYWA